MGCPINLNDSVHLDIKRFVHFPLRTDIHRWTKATIPHTQKKLKRRKCNTPSNSFEWINHLDSSFQWTVWKIQFTYFPLWPYSTNTHVHFGMYLCMCTSQIQTHTASKHTHTNSPNWYSYILNFKIILTNWFILGLVQKMYLPVFLFHLGPTYHLKSLSHTHRQPKLFKLNIADSDSFEQNLFS